MDTSVGPGPYPNVDIHAVQLVLGPTKAAVQLVLGPTKATRLSRYGSDGSDSDRDGNVWAIPLWIVFEAPRMGLRPIPHRNPMIPSFLKLGVIFFETWGQEMLGF